MRLRLPLSPRLLLASSALLGLVVYACGPEFNLLLSDRRFTLQAPPSSGFRHDAQRLVPKPALKLPVGRDLEKEWEQGLYDLPPLPDRESIDKQTLSASQFKQVQAMRAERNGERAYALGQGLPEAVRRYTAAAVDYREHDFDAALQGFAAILRLPEAAQRSRGVWANYMLGKLYSLNGDAPQAHAAFAHSRERAAQGWPDPLFLAVASYGEEARLLLDQGKLEAALTLYATQASYGDASGRSSLKQLARTLLQQPQDTRLILHNPLVQRLLAAYVLDHAGNRLQWETTFGDKPDLSDLRTQDSPLRQLTLLVQSAGLADFPESGRLAAAAYGGGDYALAQTWAERGKGAWNHWVLAKLALRESNQLRAAQHYAAALRLLTSADSDRTRLQLQGEAALLHLSRDETLKAFQLLYQQADQHWMDAAYLAERVLTVEELKAFVDRKVPQPPSPAYRMVDGQKQPEYNPAMRWPATQPAAQLRDLLARRLVRHGRYTEALPYFHAADNAWFADPQVREHVEAYASALADSRSAWTRAGRAEALYRAARLARDHGMEIMGYEMAPDYFSNGGQYEGPEVTLESNDAFVGNTERRIHWRESAPPELRFHYRHTAARLAEQAADAVPSHTQAYATLLCKAGAWVQRSDPDQSRTYYLRYLQHGALLDGKGGMLLDSENIRFGTHCPEPDFDAAAQAARAEYLQSAGQWAAQNRVSLVGLGLLLMLLTGPALWRRWRTRRPG